MATSDNVQKLSDAEFAAIDHWSRYGQQGDKQTVRVHPREEHIRGFSKPEIAAWRVVLDLNSFQRLLLGFQPEAMEDKWCIYAKGPDAKGTVSLHMHRSWTGYEIVELSIDALKGNGDETGLETAYITSITWESDQKFWGDPGEKQAKETAREVIRWVMGVNLGPDGA